MVAKTISGRYLEQVLHCACLPIKLMADLYIAAPLGACCCSALIDTKLHSQNCVFFISKYPTQAVMYKRVLQ
jgi:hypothetical protein